MSPALPNVPHAFRLRLLWSVGAGTPFGVRLFYRWSGTAPTPGAATSLADSIYTLAGGAFPSVIHPDIHQRQVILEDLTSDMGAVGEQTGTTEGTRTGGPLPIDAAFRTQYEIPRRYRGGRPASAWPLGTDTDLTSPNLWKPASITAFMEAVNSFLNGVTGQAADGCTIGEHINVSYYKGFTVITTPRTHRAKNVPTVRATPIVTTVEGVVPKHYIGSQRRRRALV